MGTIAERQAWLAQAAPLNLDPVWVWGVGLPLAANLERQLQTHGFFVQGLSGVQGAGKSTLVQRLRDLLALRGWRVLTLSLDDFYLTYADRQGLRRQDPALIWRGPPGTHDVPLALSVLQHLRQGQPTAIPRFDKSLQGGEGDRLPGETVTEIHGVLFEGWCWGYEPLSVFPTVWPAELALPAAQDFARRCNARLAAYVPLWNAADRHWWWRPQDWRWSKAWRLAAEQQQRALGKPGMGDRTCESFVEYFWQALHPELYWPSLTQSRRWHRIVTVGRDRNPLFVSPPSPL